MEILCAILLGLAVISVTTAETRHAICNLVVNSETPDVTDQIQGKVFFTQEDGGDVTLDLDLTGFDTTDTNVLHGFHVHQSGFSNGACSEAESHFNPGNVDHGAPDASVRHVGDLGNIAEDDKGKVKTTLTDSMISLTGANSIIERSIVVHEKADDLGLGGNEESLKTGNAGVRLACCVIQNKRTL